MIIEGRKKAYNIGGVFWKNCYNSNAQAISLLDWDERFFIDNPKTENKEESQNQINKVAKEFEEMIIKRSHLQ